ncbi:hypothetical protein EK21DRAFT_117004 [Setomelanomma holmii]|uniref:Uncharacterized protein n=1 Tax=Setomelanomma holmii TaxID=210430 RepID=A0A9P4LIK7_9PLEO|nr:hypothetical protein EK21DRAFT_117004 [Setomelanomma holmii]
MTITQIFTVFAGILALAGAYFYFFGIDPETKRELERKALKTMGENKMSYMAKDQINKIPTSDQEDVKQLKKSLGNAVGGVSNNPLGEQAGETADRLTSPLTGR